MWASRPRYKYLVRVLVVSRVLGSSETFWAQRLCSRRMRYVYNVPVLVVIPGALTPPVEKTLELDNGRIPLLIFSVISLTDVKNQRYELLM